MDIYFEEITVNGVDYTVEDPWSFSYSNKPQYFHVWLEWAGRTALDGEAVTYDWIGEPQVEDGGKCEVSDGCVKIKILNDNYEFRKFRVLYDEYEEWTGCILISESMGVEFDEVYFSDMPDEVLMVKPPKIGMASKFKDLFTNKGKKKKSGKY